MTGLLEKAMAWSGADPDPVTRAYIEGLAAAGDIRALEASFMPELTFGTAGIRGPVGAGPARMNRAVVIRTTYGLAGHLSRQPNDLVVVGFDARPTSKQFAEDAIGVLVAAGFKVLYFPEPTPTPLVAFAAKTYRSASAVVVTASHNPPQDNGYKVYGPNAAQIIPPADREIERLIREAPPAGSIGRVEGVLEGASPDATPVPDDIVDLYMSEVEQARPRPTTSQLRIVYTPLHGVGGRIVTRLLREGGHPGVIPVEEQFEPDGTFPTCVFPNPEEPGALDLALQRAEETNADLVIANDPDADRLAVATAETGEWRALSGNDLGCLLADFVLSNYRGQETPIVVSSIVSSPMLSEIAARRGARHEVTLTGFKWIVEAGLRLEEAGEGTFVFGYEEALGYTVGQVVRDKDGMSAALVFADLYAWLHDQGSTITDRLVGLWDEVGIWASAQHSIVGEDLGALADAVGRLGERPPATVAGTRVGSVVDYRSGASERPPWLGEQNLVELRLDPVGRVLVRPSGTEPKLKVYVDLSEQPGETPTIQQEMLRTRAGEVAVALGKMLLA